MSGRRYYSVENLFERFRVFFGINQQIRIRISSSRKLYFLNDSSSSDAAAGPLVCCRSHPPHFCLGKTVPHLQRWAAGCGSVNLLATETRKQRSSASYASLFGCMRCAPMCEVEDYGLFSGCVGEAVAERRIASFEWFSGGGGLLQVV